MQRPLACTQVEQLNKRGVDKIVCVTPDEPAKVHELAQADALKSSKVGRVG